MPALMKIPYLGLFSYVATTLILAISQAFCLNLKDKP